MRGRRVRIAMGYLLPKFAAYCLSRAFVSLFNIVVKLLQDPTPVLMDCRHEEALTGSTGPFLRRATVVVPHASTPEGNALVDPVSQMPCFKYVGVKEIMTKLKRLGNEGWGYEDVLKYFIKSERNGDPHLASTKFHGPEGLLSVNYFDYKDVNTMSIFQALKEVGLSEIDVNGVHIIGATMTQMTTARGER
ncbi:hypothetical protein PR048_000624 [Dryococelus australis]|uniref:Uncharacterized protein n=1 Tax=Dryococelus australis TaxID=614101 RepID=A0ABQ9IGE2_9NEOP|nr:hypothetical protein PR048_000624 [Dryococelus australis]